MSGLTDQPRDSWMTAALLALSAAGLGVAIQINNGIISPTAVPTLLAAFTLCVAGVGVSRWSYLTDRVRLGELVLRLLLWLGVMGQLVLLATMQPALRELPDGPPAEIVGVLAAVGVVTTLGLMNGRALRHFWFPLILVAHAGLSYWILQASPQSPVDVFLFQQESSAALVRGRNPYTVAYLNVYGPDTPFYAPELIVGRYVTFSFPYFPLSLLLVAPGYLLAGDIRYAHMASLTLAGALIGYSRPGVIAAGAAVLMLFTPRVFLILEVGWTEPVVVLLLAATVFAAMRSPRAMPVVYGLLLAVKQYLVFALPVGYLLARATRRRPLNVLAVGIAVAAAITIPFFLWNPQRFIDSVVTLQFHQPFRLDSLSIPAWLVTQGWRPMSGVVALAAGAAAVPVAWWLTRPTVSGAVTALAFIYFVFFVMNKQAFANYYFFVIAALCCAVATARFDNDRR